MESGKIPYFYSLPFGRHSLVTTLGENDAGAVTRTHLITATVQITSRQHAGPRSSAAETREHVPVCRGDDCQRCHDHRMQIMWTIPHILVMMHHDGALGQKTGK